MPYVKNEIDIGDAVCDGCGVPDDERRLSLVEGLKIWTILGLRRLYQFYACTIVRYF